MIGRLAKRSAREKELVSVRSFAIDEDNIKSFLQREILKSIIQEKRIGFEFSNGIQTSLDAVFINNDRDIVKIVSQHEGFISGVLGIEEEGFSVRDQAGRDFIFTKQEAIFDAIPERPFDALIAAAEDGDFPSGLREFLGDFFNERRLSSSSDREISNADHEAAKGVDSHDTLLVKIKSEPDDPGVEEREGVKEGAQQSCALAVATFKDHVDGELLQLLERF